MRRGEKKRVSNNKAGENGDNNRKHDREFPICYHNWDWGKYGYHHLKEWGNKTKRS